MYANDVLVLSNLGKGVVHMKHMRLLQYRLLHTTSRQLRDIQLRDIDSAQTQADLLVERCAALARRDNPEEQQRIAHLRQLWTSYKRLSQDYTVAISDLRMARADALLSGDLLSLGQRMNAESDQLFDLCDAAAARHAENVGDIALGGRIFIVIAVLMGFALYLVLWQSVSRRVMQPAKDIQDALSTMAAGPLANLQAGMNALSEGDFSRCVDTEMPRLEVRSEDEFGTTARAINLLCDRVDSIASSYGHAREALDELVTILSSAAPNHSSVPGDEAHPIRSIRNATDAIDTVLAHQSDLEALAFEANRLAEEANALTRAKSDFLANMSHELRTPMNGVLGAADLLSESTLDADQTELVDIIRSSGGLLLAIVNDVLDFSKVEAGKLTLESVPFDPAEVLTVTHRAFRAEAEKKGITLQLTVIGESAAVCGDPLRLRQVATNLVGNAIKFTPEGHVLMRCTTTRLSEAVATVRLEVEDTGIGIDPDSLAKIFDHFTQGDGSTTRKFGGTGLGLAITKELVAAMDGTMSVTSVPGIGSTFSVDLTLPLAVDDEQEQADPLSPVEPATLNGRSVVRTEGPIRVLVAEDNPVNQTVASRILRTGGYEAVAVANGRLALEMLGCETFDIVLMDWHMPEMDGLEATRAIRDSGQLWSTIPIIALTANAMESDRITCLKAGMDDYISKPFLINAFLETIGKWTGRREAA